MGLGGNGMFGRRRSPQSRSQPPGSKPQSEDGWKSRSHEGPKARSHDSAPVEGLISAVEQQERRGGKRANIYVEGRFAFSLDTELAATLHVGDPISAAEHAALVVKDQQTKA